jgi:hypothetical protein
MTKWVQAIRQTTTYLGVVMIAVIWSGVVLLASQEHERAHEDAVRQGSNLTRVLEEYVQRIVQQSDNVLLALRRDYQRDPEHFDMGNWMARWRFRLTLPRSNGFLARSISVPPEWFLWFMRMAWSSRVVVETPVVGVSLG